MPGTFPVAGPEEIWVVWYQTSLSSTPVGYAFTDNDPAANLVAALAGIPSTVDAQLVRYVKPPF